MNRYADPVDGLARATMPLGLASGSLAPHVCGFSWLALEAIRPRWTPGSSHSALGRRRKALQASGRSQKPLRCSIELLK